MKTRPVLEGEALNEIALKQYMHQQNLISKPDQDMEVLQFSNGFSNLTYLLKIEGKELVLRRPPFGAIKRGHDMGREFKVLSNLKTVFNKIPEAYCYTDDDAVLGAPFYIMEKMDGIILNLKAAKAMEVKSEDFKTISDKWLDTFVELHNVDYEAAGLSDLGRPDGYVERQITNWSKQYLKAATEEVPAAKKVMAWMDENQPKSYDHALIHNDYRYDNIVFKDDSWQEVIAVLDWEMCTLGDPLMDLGTTIAYWTMNADHDMLKTGIPSPTILPGNPGRNEVVQRYAQKSGREIKNLMFYYVYGLFKIAVIAQQIYYRYKKGLTKDPRFAYLNKSSEMLCMMALQAIEKKRIENIF